MAVAPVFVADMATLKANLRLSGVATGADAQSIIDRATSTARITLYQRLGVTLVTTLVGVAETDNPTTAEDVRRKAASVVETEMVRCELLELMPVSVADASASALQDYNDEGVWRDVLPEERADMLARCQARIEELLELILAEDELGDDVSIRVFDGGRASGTAARPAGSAFPSIGPFTGNFTFDYHYGSGDVSVRFELPADES